MPRQAATAAIEVMAASLGPWALVALFSAVLAPLRAGAQEAALAGATRIAFRESPAVALYFHVRAAAEGGDSAQAAELVPAIEAARELARALGGDFLAWGALEGLLSGVETVADIEAAFARAPETLELRGGTKVVLRAGAQKLAAALVRGESAFQEPLGSLHERLASARALWDAAVGAKEGELLAFHLKSLGMRDPELAIPVYLVGAAPWPGAVTHLDDAGRGVCFVSVERTSGSLFLETVLHEATHALDVATGGASALGELERKLQASGLDPRDRGLRDLPHALMFVQSAESIRRMIDPTHHDYGEVEKVYERFGAGAESARGFWRDHLDGKLSRAEALDAIVASLAPAPR